MKHTTPKPTQRHKRVFLTEDMEIRAKEISGSSTLGVEFAP